MKARIDVETAASYIGVTPLMMRIMIQQQKMPANVATYVRRTGAKQGHYIIWKDAFIDYYKLREVRDA